MTDYPSGLQLPYLAGLIDGEGCITAGRNHGASLVVLRIQMATHEPLRSVAAWFPQSRLTCWRGVWALAWHGRGAETMLTIVRPFLLLKGEQAEVALSICELQREARRLSGYSGRTPATIRLKIDVLTQRLRALKAADAAAPFVTVALADPERQQMELLGKSIVDAGQVLEEE